MRNTAIYTQLHAAHSSRIVKIDGADIEQYSQQSIGTINGQHRSLPAIVSSGVAPDDQWVIINLTDSRSGHGLHTVACSDEYMDGRYVGSVAVLGALDDAQAKIWALRQFGQAYGANSASVVRDVSPQAIKLLLDNPASAEGLAISSSTLRKFEGRVTLTDVIWNGGLLKSPERSVDLIHQMQILDTDSQLLDAMSASDMPMLLNELGAVEAEYDALIVEYGSGDGSGIKLLMQRLNAAMHKASIGKVKPINVTTTKPFKRNGVTNVAVLFEFDDGQSITLVFHNPDSTPGKLTSSDILTSWKIMLNKRDVTAALSPKEGDNVQLPDLAKRILLVVEKNSARFQRANAKKTEDIAALGDAQARVESKKSILAGKLGEIDSLEKAIDGAARQATVAPQPTTTTTDLGNNDSVSRGLAVNGDGTFTAMTATESKTFKTRSGAERWLAQRGFNPDGSALEKPLPREIDVVDLHKMGVVEITHQGNENIYFVKDGREHYSKVMTTENYPVGEFDLSKYPTGLPPAATTEEPEMPKANPDAEFFQSIIDGTIDPLTVDIDHVIELAEKHEGNAAMEVLIDQALEAINQAEQAAAQAV